MKNNKIDWFDIISFILLIISVCALIIVKG